MVHTKRCPLGKRGNPTTEFYIGEIPQIYCMGWIDKRTAEAIKTCKNCLDWVHGEQCLKDFEAAKKNATNIQNRAKELLPCPFCGNEAHIREIHGTIPKIYVAVCNYGCCSSKGYTSIEDVIKHWNTRV